VLKLSKTVGALWLASLAVLAAAPAPAQDYPSRPIRLIIPYAAGGASDIMARLIGHKMEERFKQAVIPENRPGANAVVGATAMLAAPRDGYTMLIASASVLTPTFIKSPPFDALKDLEPVCGLLGASYGVMVNPAVPAKTLQEFLAYARANPGKLNGGTSTASSLLFLEMFRAAAGIELVRVNYKGSVPAATALIANEIQVTLDNPGQFRPQIADGRIRVLAVTGKERVPYLPDVPTTAEAGMSNFGNVAGGTTAFFVGAGAPRADILKLNAVVNAILKEADITERILAIGAYPIGGTPEDQRARIAAEAAYWAEAAKRANFQPE
jgi:tripartite-type tricarboxylate transporter receptor subunit TctC